jgi:hypothetical protein
MATFLSIGNNIKVAIQNISYIEGKEIVLNNRHRFTVSDEVIEQVNTFLRNRDTGVFHYKGTVDTLADLPDTATDGDFYKVESESKYYAWNGIEWDDQITIVNLDGEVTERIAAEATLQTNINNEVSRAQAKEAELEEAVDEEKNRAEKEEAYNVAAISEINRAIGLSGSRTVTLTRLAGVFYTSGQIKQATNNYNGYVIRLEKGVTYIFTSAYSGGWVLNYAPVAGAEGTGTPIAQVSYTYTPASDGYYAIINIASNSGYNSYTYTENGEYGVQGQITELDSVTAELQGDVSDIADECDANSQMLGSDKTNQITLSNFAGVFYSSGHIAAANSSWDGFVIPAKKDCRYLLSSECQSVWLIDYAPTVGAEGAGINLATKGYVIDIEEDGMYIVVNIQKSSGYTSYAYTEEEHRGIVGRDIPTLYALVSPLAGKRVVCLGDSITEFGKGGIRYSDHLAEMSGATVYNLGKGGARLTERRTPSLTPADNQEALAAFEICNTAYALAHADYSYMDAAIASGFLTSAQQTICEKIRQVISSIDIANIDVITVLGGTNDYTGGVQIGLENQSTTDKTTIRGAINYIVSELLTANPKLKIYCFSPLIRMFDSTISIQTSSDVYIHSSQSVTLKEYSKKIEEAFADTHLPCCDLYNGMGWNVFNFAPYFKTSTGTQDYTHPYSGFDYLARKMLSFIISNW